jgi:hypothetical protein
MIRRAGVLTGQFQSGLQQLLRPAFSPRSSDHVSRFRRSNLKLRQILLIAIAIKLGEMGGSTVRSYAIAP